MESVIIPSRHFLERVMREYGDYRSALIREILQNSIDSGASQIDFTVTDTTLSVQDNGCGIAHDKWVSSLLTLGGSDKPEQAIGGMGAAKELILFAHPKWSIGSFDTVVEGAGPSYAIQRTENRISGTRVEITFDPIWCHSAATFCNKLVDWLQKSHCRKTTITLTLPNGDTRVFKPDYIGKPHPDFPVTSFGVFLAGKNQPDASDSHFALVRINGLLMFSVYLGVTTKKQVIFEVINSPEAPALRVINQNRDGFKHVFFTEFMAAVSAIIRKHDHIARYEPRVFTYLGRGSSASMPGSGEFADSASCPSLGIPVEEILAKATKDLPPVSSPSEVAEQKRFSWDTSQPVLTNSIVVDLADSSYSMPPKKYQPEGMSAENTWYLKAWVWCLKRVIAKAAINKPWIVGFTLASTDQASCAQPFEAFKSQGHPLADFSVFLLNPTVFEYRDRCRSERILPLIVTACHEVAHVDHKCHGSDHNRATESYIVSALTNLPGTNTILKEVDAIVL